MLYIHIRFAMGRQSIEKKRAKRKQQKRSAFPVLETVVITMNYLLVPQFSPAHAEVNIGDSNTHLSNDEDTSIGNDDTDLIEMRLYGEYRNEDGEQYTNHYLKKSMIKLREKTQQYKVRICELETENMKMKLEHKEQRERIQKYYDTIAFGRSQSGRLVRMAMGTTSAAGKIIEELKTLYSVEQDYSY